MSTRIAACLMIALAMPALAPAQESEAEAYRPLFTPEMIQKASPEQAARMRMTEERNRKAWDERQEALRRRAQASEQATAGPTSRPSAVPPRAKSKVYRWVDKDGRVHFGDAPGGQGAKEVEVGGIARVKGHPPPPPGSTGGEKD